MSYPYPEDRTREKREFEPKVYAENREKLADAEAADQTEAERWGKTHQQAEGEELHARLEENLEDEAKRVQARMQDDQANETEGRAR
jgi:hypothetical protein